LDFFCARDRAEKLLTEARLGKKIIYLPIRNFSPVTLKKIRQFHVLDGHHVRRCAICKGSVHLFIRMRTFSTVELSKQR
jgi:hypothetical protein